MKPWSLVFFAAFLLLVAAIGGSSRGDEIVLVVLRPAAVLALGYFAWRLTSAQFVEFRFLFLLLIGCVALVAIHLIPLPPWLWQALPGRALTATIDRTVGLAGVWRPISLAPHTTWNALFALAVPLAALAGFAGLERAHRRQVLAVIVGIGLLSGLVGLFQAIGPPEGPFHYYPSTQGSFAIGLLANRNHQALLLACLFPMIATAISCWGPRAAKPWLVGMIALGLAALVVPLLLLTGSRSGLLLGAVGLLAATILYRAPQRSDAVREPSRYRRFAPIALVGAAVAGLVGVTLAASRGFAVDRLLVGEVGGELRLSLWTSTADLARDYFPWGSGLGAFVETYEIIEPHAALGLGYANHAHNDVLEVALGGGLPALVLLVVALVAWGRASWRVFRSPRTEDGSTDLARLGSIVLAMAAIASLTDYPLRVPLIAALAVIAAAWLTQAAVPRSRRHATS